jgi:hypothetical protein
LPYCLSNVSPLIIKFVFCLAENKSEYPPYITSAGGYSDSRLTP